MSRTLILTAGNARERMKAAWDAVCAVLQHPGQRVRVKVEPYQPTRSLDQNAKFHAICGDIAKQRQWAGQTLDTEAWKRLLVDAWARVEGKEQGRIVPSLDGQSVVNLGIQTRRLRVAQMADLIEFALAWCAENGITLADDPWEDRNAA